MTLRKHPYKSFFKMNVYIYIYAGMQVRFNGKSESMIEPCSKDEISNIIFRCRSEKVKTKI